MPAKLQLTDYATANLRVVGAVSFYVVVSLIMVLGNKWVLIVSEAPITFIWLQVVIAVVLMNVTSWIRPSLMELPVMDMRTSKHLGLYVLVGAAGFIFNTYCLKLVDASYYQVARGLTLPFTVILEHLSTSHLPQWTTVACCLIVTYGFMHSVLPTLFNDLFVSSESEDIRSGCLVGAIAAALLALHAVMIKSSLKYLDGKTMHLAYYGSVLNSGVLFVVLVFAGELKLWPQLFTPAFCIGTLMTGFIGFVLSIAGILSVKITSPVSHMVTSAARTALQTCLGAWIFGDIITTTRLQSILLIFTGTTLYIFAKSKRPIATVDEPGEKSLRPLTTKA